MSSKYQEDTLFIRRHEDYWKDHVKQKIELEHRLEAML